MSFLRKSYKASTSPTMLPRSAPLNRYIALAIFILFVLYFHKEILGTTVTDSHDQTPPSAEVAAIVHNISSPGDPSPIPPIVAVDDLTWVREVLQENSIGPEITYASRTIRYIPDAKERKPITEVDHDLIPQGFKKINIKRLKTLPAIGPIEVHLKKSLRPDGVDGSDLLFGASTTYERFTSEITTPIEEWKRWFTDGQGHSNGAGLILTLFNTTQEEIDHVGLQLHAVGIDATVMASDSTLDMAGRYVALIALLYNHPTRDSRKYFALIDDDTFFPCLNELQRILARYDPAKSYYIGTFTERAEWLLDHKVAFAYGGGGIFLTAPVAKSLAELPCLEKDEDGDYILDSDQGDRLLYNCLVTHTETRLTYLPLLHQEDQFGDQSGFYESGRQPLSLHHYKSWHFFDVEKMHYVADACGEDCVLQRFQFKDNYIISNGYSVANYPKGIDFDPLLMEGTFDSRDDIHEVSLSYSFGAMRPSLSRTGRKMSWELLSARREGDGKVRQIYVKHRSDSRWTVEGEKGPKDDSILVLEWIP